MEFKSSIQFKLSCYCCGGVDFENIERRWNKIEGMYFLDFEDKEKVKCLSCGLVDYLHNLVPRGFVNKN